jgi:hypothetical protein
MVYLTWKLVMFLMHLTWMPAISTSISLHGEQSPLLNIPCLMVCRFSPRSNGLDELD